METLLKMMGVEFRKETDSPVSWEPLWQVWLGQRRLAEDSDYEACVEQAFFVTMGMDIDTYNQHWQGLARALEGD